MGAIRRRILLVSPPLDKTDLIGFVPVTPVSLIFKPLRRQKIPPYTCIFV
jgi:hypothetical protein